MCQASQECYTQGVACWVSAGRKSPFAGERADISSVGCRMDKFDWTTVEVLLLRVDLNELFAVSLCFTSSQAGM